MGAWAFDHQRDALARAGLTVAYTRGCWRVYRGNKEVARRTTASEMRAYLAKRFKCSGPGENGHLTLLTGRNRKPVAGRRADPVG